MLTVTAALSAWKPFHGLVGCGGMGWDGMGWDWMEWGWVRWVRVVQGEVG